MLSSIFSIPIMNMCEAGKSHFHNVCCAMSVKRAEKETEKLVRDIILHI